MPHKPGVYIFKAKSGLVLYIGKATDLKNRVTQYFQQDASGKRIGDGRLQIPFLMADAVALEHIITDNEWESLVLENSLIKKYRPKYNIKLRDDKNYSFIKIDFETEIPQIYTVRNPDSKNAKYFGPYSSTAKIRETLRLVRKIFPFCANKVVGSRPCFYYYIHRCPGVCIGKVSLEEYKGTMDKISLFLAGNISEVKKDIKNQMSLTVRTKRFERAAELRDQLKALEIINERQKVVFAQKVSWDFISYYSASDKTAINVFSVRGGKLIDKKNFILEDTLEKGGQEIINAFLPNYYLPDGAIQEDLPKEIFVQENPDIKFILNKNSKPNQQKIKISKPSRGKKVQLIKLGAENAKDFFENWIKDQASEISRTTLALAELQKVLQLKKIPQRIECFDISNIQGTNSVASMVVVENGRPKKSEYRKFKMKIDGTPNDFAMMQETLTRRFKTDWPLPDLLVVDGGKGQLGMAVKVLESYNLKIPVIGLAKRDEEIFVPGKSESIKLPKSHNALQLLQRLRDEAHRFAITFHKSLRSKQAYKSSLDEIPGVGPKTKKLLVKQFGSVAEIKKASHQELEKLVGTKLASKILGQV